MSDKDLCLVQLVQCPVISVPQTETCLDSIQIKGGGPLIAHVYVTESHYLMSAPGLMTRGWCPHVILKLSS